jgi:hypothetical protein
LWYHSRRKAEFDEAARGERCRRAIQKLLELQDRLRSPRTRFRTRLAVETAVGDVRSRRGVESLLCVEIIEEEEETFRKPGRPSQNSNYQRDARGRFRVTRRLNDLGRDNARIDDGVFPLLTNDRKLSALEVLQAYKRQPEIKKRRALGGHCTVLRRQPAWLPPRVTGTGGLVRVVTLNHSHVWSQRWRTYRVVRVS